MSFLRGGDCLPPRRQYIASAVTRDKENIDRADAPEIPQIFASENIAYISDIHVIIFAYVIDF